MAEVQLPGCTAEPLSNYLKALGLMRIVADQVDPTTRARWAGDVFVLNSVLSFDGLVDFLVEDYVPTPVITPWNSGSGFGAEDARKSPAAFNSVKYIKNSTDSRLTLYRLAIRIASELTQRPGWAELDKAVQVTLCRSNLPDKAIDWIDAAVVITTDSRTFPPLLGTGGNDGRLDFGSNFMARVVDVLGLSEKPRSLDGRRKLAAAALTGQYAGVELDKAKIGQFDPVGAGGPRSSSDGSADSLSNPWDFVLLFEGAIAFASGAARRFGSSSSFASVPFTVGGVAAAYGSAAAEESRGEFWAPLWRESSTAAEVLRLLSEGRAEYRGRQARNALDIARALSTFGVDRGIDEFVRYGFLQRNGLSTFCVPVGRISVKERDRAALLGDLDPWLSQLRSASNLPAQADALLRGIDEEMINVSTSDSNASLLAVLSQAGQLWQRASRSDGLRERTGYRPLRPRARQWMPLLDDGTSEFRLAAGIASLRAIGDSVGWFRGLIADATWNGRRPSVQGFGQRPLLDVLGDCLSVLAQRATHVDPTAPDTSWCSPSTAVSVSSSAFTQFALNQVDIRVLAGHLYGLMLLDWDSYSAPDGYGSSSSSVAEVHPVIAAVKPVFHHRGIGRDPRVGRPLWARRSVARQLQAGSIRPAVAECLRLIRIAGCAPLGAPSMFDTRVDPALVASCALIPIADGSAVRLLSRIAHVDHNKRREESNEQR